MNGAFADSAARLAGSAGAMLGWAPCVFWAATPAELAGIFQALGPSAETPAPPERIALLKEQFPDG